MLMHWTEIHFQLTAMEPMSSHEGEEKGTASAHLPTWVINRLLSLDRDHIKGFNSEPICRLVRISNVCGIQDEWAWNLFYDIICLDPVTTRQVTKLQLIWLHRRSRSSPFCEWWAAFFSFMGQMFDKTCNQMNNCHWDNPVFFGDHVDCCSLKTSSSGQVKCTSKRSSLYGSDDLRAKIGSPSYR
jgi:hypothetical protein